MLDLLIRVGVTILRVWLSLSEEAKRKTVEAILAWLEGKLREYYRRRAE